jgi:hypothetical protein
MHVPLRAVDGAIEEPSQQVQESQRWQDLCYCPTIGYGGYSVEHDLGEDVNWHCCCGSLGARFRRLRNQFGPCQAQAQASRHPHVTARRTEFSCFSIPSRHYLPLHLNCASLPSPPRSIIHYLGIKDLASRHMTAPRKEHHTVWLASLHPPNPTNRHGPHRSNPIHLPHPPTTPMPT